MIIGIGVDIVEVDRIAAALERFGSRFAERVFTPAEVRYCDSKANRVERYAARFAAKEAGFKALGTGWSRGIGWQEVVVEREASGRPTLVLRGRAGEFAARLGAKHVFVSLSHTTTYAVAQVVLEG